MLLDILSPVCNTQLPVCVYRNICITLRIISKKCIDTEPQYLLLKYNLLVFPEMTMNFNVVIISGTTRDNFQGRKVLQLEYEAYNDMALKEMKKICSLIRDKWPVENIAIYHRLG